MLILPVPGRGVVPDRPYGTAALVLANWAVALLLGCVEPWYPLFEGLVPGVLDSWIHDWDSFDPLTWITSAFVHGNVAHVAGNMLFLLTFGCIVEGEIGWRRLLGVYFGVAIATGLVEHLALAMFGGGSFGASSCIYALMVMAWLWAPHRKVDVVMLWLAPRYTELTVRALALWFVSWQFLGAAVRFFMPSSAMLHLIGVGVGFGAGYALLRIGWATAEGRDRSARRSEESIFHFPEDLPPAKRPDWNLRPLARLLLAGAGGIMIVWGLLLVLWEAETQGGFLGAAALIAGGVVCLYAWWRA